MGASDCPVMPCTYGPGPGFRDKFTKMLAANPHCERTPTHIQNCPRRGPGLHKSRPESKSMAFGWFWAGFGRLSLRHLLRGADISYVGPAFGHAHRPKTGPGSSAREPDMHVTEPLSTERPVLTKSRCATVLG
jgi:hypothetical protein